jgi:hypothetical protein
LRVGDQSQLSIREDPIGDIERYRFNDVPTPRSVNDGGEAQRQRAATALHGTDSI